jgi:hypothetical protein
LRFCRPPAILARVSTGLLLFAIVSMIVLEIQHLRWIWWEYWVCRDCGVKNKHCACRRFKWQIWI